MAKHAVAPLETPTAPYIRHTDKSDIGADAVNALMDISVDDVERDALLDSRWKARVQVELHLDRSHVLDSVLAFISRHAAGRGMLSSLLDDGTLLMTFGVSDASEVSAQLVRDFAGDVTRIFGRPPTDVVEATVIEVDDERLHRALAALGVRRPDLKPV